MHFSRNPLHAAILLACFAPMSAHAVNVPVIDDANLATLNVGTAVAINVNSTNNGLMKFDLSALPAGILSSDIAKATLVFYVKTMTTSGQLQATPIISTWSETTVTTVTAPTLGTVAAPTATINRGNTFYALDVTNLVQDWVDTPASNFGLALGTATAALTLDSKEAIQTSHPAYIEIALQGPAGPQGFQGATGSQGVAGPQGGIGPQGANGSQGVPGSQGPQGANGTNGSQGVPGSQGPQGANGTNGSQGAPGLQGPQGANGTDGSQGAPGSQGPQGANGTDGSQGAPGPQGPQGANGTDGSQGPQGFQGAAGSNGTQGPQGANGTNGTNGSTGLQGPQGANGTNGTNGTNGSQGAPGPQGPQGASGGGLAVYNSAGTSLSNPKIVTGTTGVIGTSSSTTVTFSGSAAFTAGSTPNCTITSIHNANGAGVVVKITAISNASLTIQNTNAVNTPSVSYICVGN